SGFTPQLETTVWVGYPQGEIPMENVHGIAVAGGTFPATIWRLFMEVALAKAAALDWRSPLNPVVWRPWTQGQYGSSLAPVTTGSYYTNPGTTSTPQTTTTRPTTTAPPPPPPPPAVTILLVALVLGELGASRRRLLASVGLLALAPVALGPISLNTYDAWPAMLTVLALYLLLRGRDLAAAGVLGLAVSAKVYPLVLVPLAGIYVWRRAGRRRVALGLAVFAAVMLAVVLPFAAYDAHGVLSSFRSQAERGLQVGSLAASFLLVDDRLGL